MEKIAYVVELEGWEHRQKVCVLLGDEKSVKEKVQELNKVFEKAIKASSDWYCIRENIKYPAKEELRPKFIEMEKDLRKKRGDTVKEFITECQKLNIEFTLEHEINVFCVVSAKETAVRII